MIQPAGKCLGETSFGRVVTKWTMVTPELAAKWLKRNRQNRRLNQSKVTRYASMFTSGRYKITHQGAALDVNEILIDAQHRLEGIVLSGVTVPMLVTYNLEPIARTATDVGDSRGPSDLIAIVGVNGISRDSARMVSGAINAIRTGAYGQNDRQEWEDLKAEIVKYKDGIRWAVERFEEPIPTHTRRLRSAPAIGAFIFAYPSAPEIVSAAHRSFESGLFDSFDTIKQAHDIMLAGAVPGGGTMRKQLFGKVATAIFMKLLGKKVNSRLYFNQDAIEYFKGFYK